MRLDHITPKQLYVVCYVASYRCNITSCYRFQIGTIGDRFKSVPDYPTELLGNYSVLDPPDPIPNSEVKRFSADGSVGSPHVRVGHRQDLFTKSRSRKGTAFFVPDTLEA